MRLIVLFSFTATIIGAILATIILYGQRQTSARFLACFFLILSACNFINFLFEDENFYISFLISLRLLLNYFIAPSIYFYIVFALNKKQKLHWIDTLHLLPTLLFMVDYFPLNCSNAYKSYFLETPFQYEQNDILLREGWLLSTRMHILFRNIIALLYVFYLVRLLSQPISFDSKSTRLSRFFLNWIKMIITLLFLFSLAGLATNFFVSSIYVWTSTFIEPVIILMILSLTLFLQPNILYGSYLSNFQRLPIAKQKQLILNEDNLVKVQAKLQGFIDRQEFLRKNIKLNEVADELNVQPYILSAYINQVYQLNFNELINWCRVEYIVKDGLMNSQWRQLTLEAIAEKAGFNNRTTFLNAFKKFTGKTPTGYLYEQRNKGEGETNPRKDT